jgi:hypothetical protein
MIDNRTVASDASTAHTGPSLGLNALRRSIRKADIHAARGN